MNRVYLDMIHSLDTNTTVFGVKGMEMSVLEQQRMVLKRQQEQLIKVQQQKELSCYNDLSMLSFLPAPAEEFRIYNMAAGPTVNEIMDRPIKVDPSTENGWVDFGMRQSGVTLDRSGVGSPGQVENRGRESSSPSRKRKAEKNQMTPKVGITGKGNSSKRSKGCQEEEESKITEQSNNRNSSQSKQREISGNDNSNRKNKETSGCTSKDNSKASEVQKPDYIHVRARRGQATDSHSLAERVRREKISERMRYLQDLVPGCNKITGKAGMLDEIINYVQSLQRQVEFLSMKLAAVSPSLDFNIDDLIAKEMLAACSGGLSTMAVSQDLTNPDYLQYIPIQHMDPACGSEIIVNSSGMGLQRNISAPASMPENFFDTSCFNQITNNLLHDADLQSIYNMEFQQGRSSVVPLQPFTGNTEASSLKMEI